MTSRRNFIGSAIALPTMAGVALLARAAKVDGVRRPYLGFFTEAVGSTPDEIHQNFGRTIERHFNLRAAEPWRMERLMRRLTDLDLQSLAQAYTTATVNAGYGSRLLDTMALGLNERSLSRLALYFGFEPVYNALARTSMMSKKGELFAKVADTSVAAPTLGLSSMKQGDSRTNASIENFLQLTLYETYLAFRTAPYGAALGVRASLFMTTSVWGGPLYLAWQGGSTVGSGISKLIENYAPELNDAIGGTIDVIIERIHDATNSLERGREEGAGSTSFELGPISGSTLEQSGGDYGAVSDWTYWADNGGGLYGDGGGGGGGGGAFDPVLL